MSLPKFYTMKRYRVVTFIEVRHIVFAGIVNYCCPIKLFEAKQN